MWHWVQGVAPRRLAEAPLPEPTRDRLAAVRAAGWEPVFANLGLDTVPVVLCLLRAPGRLALGLAAARNVADAAAKALGEGLMIGGIDAEEPRPATRAIPRPCAPPRTTSRCTITPITPPRTSSSSRARRSISGDHRPGRAVG